MMVHSASCEGGQARLSLRAAGLLEDGKFVSDWQLTPSRRPIICGSLRLKVMENVLSFPSFLDTFGGNLLVLDSYNSL